MATEVELPIDPDRKMAEGTCFALGCDQPFTTKPDSSFCDGHDAQARKIRVKKLCVVKEPHDHDGVVSHESHICQDAEGQDLHEPQIGPPTAPPTPKPAVVGDWGGAAAAAKAKLSLSELLAFERANKEVTDLLMATKMAELSYKNAVLAHQHAKNEFYHVCLELGFDLAKTFDVDKEGNVVYVSENEGTDMVPVGDIARKRIQESRARRAGG
jgi:hypothetical protein